MSTKTRIANLKRIQSIFDKLDNQTLVRQELDELVHLTAELHEKAVILRYKAAEERVFGNGDVVKKSEAKNRRKSKRWGITRKL